MAQSEPWYGVRMLYQHTGLSEQTFEERVLIVRAPNFDAAIETAEGLSKEEYESDTTKYLGYAMAFNIFDEEGSALGAGTEVFSLMRTSHLTAEDYIDRFHDTGRECTKDLTDS